MKNQRQTDSLPPLSQSLMVAALPIVLLLLALMIGQGLTV